MRETKSRVEVRSRELSRQEGTYTIDRGRGSQTQIHREGQRQRQRKVGVERDGEMQRQTGRHTHM